MISIKDLQIREYNINLDIEPNSIIGFYGRDKSLIYEFLLIIAGINRSKNKCFYQKLDLYDSDAYFKDRIYLDCSKGYLQTLTASHIISSIQGNFKKSLDKKILSDHLKNLAVRGECEITTNYKYIFTKIGNTLANIAILLTSDNHLIINNPTIHLTRKKDIDYIYSELSKRSTIVVLGLNNLLDAHKCHEVYLFTESNLLIEVSPKNDTFIIIDDCDIIDQYKVFKITEKQWIVRNVPKDIIRQCARNKVDYTKVSFDEIIKYI